MIGFEGLVSLILLVVLLGIAAKMDFVLLTVRVSML